MKTGICAKIRSIFVCSQATDASYLRYRSIFRGGATAVLARGVSAILTLVAVPLTLNHLGPERYGLWVTLFSLFAWLTLVDFGLANGLMNALSEAYGKQERTLARQYISVAFWGLVVFSLLASVMLIVVANWCDWAGVFQIESAALSDEFTRAVFGGIILVMIMLPLTIVGKIYIAHQRGEIANAWSTASSLGGFVGLACAVFLNADLPMLVIAFLGGQLIVGLCNALWLFGWSNPDLRPTIFFDRDCCGRIFKVSIAFFLAQIATLMQFQSANIIIANSLGPSQVTPFQITWLLFSYVLLPQQLVASYVWAAVGEAHARNDLAWLRRLLGRFSALSLAYGLCALLPITMFYDIIIEHWVGVHAVPTRGLALWIAAWIMLQAVMHPLVAILGGTGRLHGYAAANMIAACLAVFGAFWAVGNFGAAGVVAAITISFGVVSVLPALYLTWKVLKEPTQRDAAVAS